MESENMNYGLCRCCSARGNHRDLMKEYYFNGVRELYADIFAECFNLLVTRNPKISTLICMLCIQRLREANSFRMMVAATERQLLDAIHKPDEDKNTVFIKVPVSESNIKLEIMVKREQSDDDDLDFESDDARSVSMLGKLGGDHLVEGEAEFLKRFHNERLKPLPTRSSLYKICSNYVKRLDKLQGKVIKVNMIQKYSKGKRSEIKYITEKLAQIVNISTILEHSNVAAFKTKTRSGFPCFYCRNIFDNLEILREHQYEEHSRKNTKQYLKVYAADYLVVYADVTDLKCTICYESISNLNELKNHLVAVHKKKMYLDFNDRVIPYKSNGEHFLCQVCGISFETFGSVEKHMNLHYGNYICEECGSGFVTKHRLTVHMYSVHIRGNHPCKICHKVYSTHQKLKAHVDGVHRNVKKNKCPKCSQRFTDYFERQKHMVTAHGLAPLEYKCNVCQKTFNRRYVLAAHIKRKHLEQKDLECGFCDYKCYTKRELNMHMVKHTGERIFECTVCKKSYARKKTLKEHLKIHYNDRRFICAVCGLGFVQNCSLKGHMKTHHLDYFNGMH